MSLSAKTEYACIAVLELAASHGSGQPVRLREIAESHGVPSGFLVQILQQLKNAGLVRSTRGAAGGYQLARSADEITLADVVSAIEGPSTSLGSSKSNASAASQVILDAWRGICDAQWTLLESTTFAALAERVREEAENMYYI